MKRTFKETSKKGIIYLIGGWILFTVDALAYFQHISIAVGAIILFFMSLAEQFEK